MPADKYTPPPIPGMVFASNSPCVEDGVTLTEDLASARTARTLNVPVDVIRTIRFEPDGRRSPYAIGFASYVEKEYEGRVVALNQRLDAMLKALSHLYGGWPQ